MDAWKNQMIRFAIRDILLAVIFGAITYWTLSSIIKLMPAWYVVIGFVFAVLTWFIFATGDTDGISIRNLIGLPFLLLFGWMGTLVTTAIIIAYEFWFDIRQMFHPVK